MANSFDRRSFIFGSALAAAGTLLPAASLGADPSQNSPAAEPTTPKGSPTALGLHNGTEAVRRTVSVPEGRRNARRTSGKRGAAI